MHVSPRALNQAANDAVPILFISAAALAAAMLLYAFTVVLSVACLGVHFEIFDILKTAFALGATVLAVGLGCLACAVRRALQIGA